MKYPKITLIISCFIILFFLSGILLDNEAQRVVNQLYPRNKEGILEKMQPINKIQGYSKGLILIHGFQSSPSVWSDLIQDIGVKVQADIYAPLLPFHGKNLETLKKLDTDILQQYIKHTIDDLSKKYQTLTVVGFSLSGALIANLAQKNALPKNVQIILYNPAIFLKKNTPLQRLEMNLYSLWRDNCNYTSLGCDYPHYASGDPIAKATIDKQPTLLYDVIPAALQVYKLDLKTRNALHNLSLPYHLVISKDDNYINYLEQKAACQANQIHCHLHSFTSGKHLIHAGANKQAFEALLIELNNTYPTS